jgi:hypothetical protein
MLTSVVRSRRDEKRQSPTAVQDLQNHHRLAMSYFNRAGWYLKKNDVNRAASDLSEAIALEPDFAAALTKRGTLGGTS